MVMHIQMKYKRHTMCIQIDSWKEIICHMLGKDFGNKTGEPQAIQGNGLTAPTRSLLLANGYSRS